jgi:hypothetical protein
MFPFSSLEGGFGLKLIGFDRQFFLKPKFDDQKALIIPRISFNLKLIFILKDTVFYN